MQPWTRPRGALIRPLILAAAVLCTAAGLRAAAVFTGMAGPLTSSPYVVLDSYGGTMASSSYVLRQSGGVPVQAIKITGSIAGTPGVLWGGFLLRRDTDTPTITPTFTATDTPTFTPTATPTFTQTATPTFTQTTTPTFTQTITPSPSDTGTATPTFSPTPTRTPTPSPSNTASPFPTPAGSNTGNGLCGEYYDNEDFTNFKGARTENVDFDWGDGNPGFGMGDDTFSIVWQGQIEAPYDGDYTFTTDSDDGVSLTVGTTVIIDKWLPQDSVTNTAAPVYLTAGSQTNIKLQYYEHTGQASVALYWQHAYIPQQIIPVSRLYSVGCGTTATITPSFTLTATPSWTATPSATATGTGTPSRTPSPTPSDTPSATATPTYTASPSASATPTVTPSITPQAQLALSKLSDAFSIPAVAGQQVDYVLSLTNTGSLLAQNVSVWDTLPANATLLSGSTSPGFAFAGGVLSWGFGGLGAGASADFSYTLSYTGSGSAISNVAWAQADDAPLVGSNPVDIAVGGPAFTATPTATPSASPSITPTFTETGSFTETGTFSATATPSTTPSSTDSPTLSSTETPSDTITVSPTFSNSPSATSSITGTDTLTPELLDSVTATPTFSVSPTQTPTASSTPSSTVTDSPSDTSTASPSDTPSATPTSSATVSPTLTDSASFTPSVTATPSVTTTGSDSPSATPTLSATATPSATGTPSASASSTLSPSASATPTPSISATSSDTLTVSATSTPSPTSSPTSSATPSATPSPSLTVTPSPTLTVTTTATPRAPSLALSAPTVSIYPGEEGPAQIVLDNSTGIGDVQGAQVYVDLPYGLEFSGPGGLQPEGYAGNDSWQDTTSTTVLRIGPFTVPAGSSLSVPLDLEVQSSTAGQALNVAVRVVPTGLGLPASTTLTVNALAGTPPTHSITPTFSHSPTSSVTPSVTATPTFTPYAGSPTDTFSVTPTLTVTPQGPALSVQLVLASDPAKFYVGQDVSFTVQFSNATYGAQALGVQIYAERDAGSANAFVGEDPNFPSTNPDSSNPGTTFWTWVDGTDQPASEWFRGPYPNVFAGFSATGIPLRYQILDAAAGQTLITQVSLRIAGVATGVSATASFLVPKFSPTPANPNTPTITPTPIVQVGQVAAYPQPAATRLCFEYFAPSGSGTDVSFDIYNLAFKKAAHIKDTASDGVPQNTCVDISGLAPGLYIVQAHQGSFVFPTFKFGVAR